MTLPRSAIRRILVALDPQRDEAPVLRRAAALGRAFGAALRMTSCVSEPYAAGERFSNSPALEEARQALVATRLEALDALAAPLARAGLAVSVTARWAYPVVDALAEEAAAFGADLLVAGRRPQATPGRLAFTASDWQLIRKCPCPVLITHGAADDGLYRDILVPVDPMHAHDRPAALDDALIAAAQALGGPAGARLRLLHCYLPAEYLPFRAPGAVSPAAFHRRESSIAGHRNALQQLAQRHAIAPEDVLLEPADARQAIPEAAARLGADLVVMGAVARSRLQRLLIGSTADSVLDRLPCDVLVVKPAASSG